MRPMVAPSFVFGVGFDKSLPGGGYHVCSSAQMPLAAHFGRVTSLLEFFRKKGLSWSPAK
jgi:hypothetical protein